MYVVNYYIASHECLSQVTKYACVISKAKANTPNLSLEYENVCLMFLILIKFMYVSKDLLVASGNYLMAEILTRLAVAATLQLE